MAKKPKGMKFSQLFGTDEDLEVQGVWIEYESGVRIKIARLGNKEMQEHLRKKNSRLLKRVGRGESIPAEVADKIMKDGIAKFVLKGWEGILDDAGKPIEFTEERARMLLETKDFFREVFELSQSRELFQREDDEEAAKN